MVQTAPVENPVVFCWSTRSEPILQRAFVDLTCAVNLGVTFEVLHAEAFPSLVRSVGAQYHLVIVMFARSSRAHHEWPLS